MSGTNVPPITWVNGAPIVPTEQEIQAGRQADFVAAYGGGINLAPTTAQGQIITSDTAIIGDTDSQIVFVASMVDPDQAEGVWQDAIGAIYFLQRKAAQGSVKTVTCIGANGVIITAGALIRDPSGFLWAATISTEIVGGPTDVTFQCQTPGPIAWPANTPCTIYTQIDGWDQAVSTNAAALGNFVENRASFENRRRNSVAINSHGTTEAIFGSVSELDGVLSAYVIDNPTGSTVDEGTTGYPAVAHSVLVSVYGGTAAQIAQAIWTAKDAGCAYNGNTTVTVYDTSYPLGSQPSYPVTWLVPTPKPLYFAVVIQSSPSLPADIVALVQEAVLETFTGTDDAGSIPAGIASVVSSSRYAPQINLISAAVNIVSIGVSFQTETTEGVGTGDGATVTFGHTTAHNPVIPGTVVISAGLINANDDGNGNLVGTGVATGSVINYATGVLSITYSVAPPNLTTIGMAYAYAASVTSVLTMGIDQMPTLTLEQVSVALV